MRSGRKALSAQFGVEVTTDNLAAAQQADVILLGVKPTSGAGADRRDQACADPEEDGALVCGFGEDAEHRGWGGCELAVIRAMPNTPAMLAAGITALCSGRFVPAEQMAVAQRIFQTSADGQSSMRSIWTR